MFCDFDTLSHFEISEFNEFSDHAPLSFNIYLNNQDLQHENLNTQTDTEFSRKIVWDDEKKRSVLSNLLAVRMIAFRG